MLAVRFRQPFQVVRLIWQGIERTETPELPPTIREFVDDGDIIAVLVGVKTARGKTGQRLRSG
jgi:hypothetical protein